MPAAAPRLRARLRDGGAGASKSRNFFCVFFQFSFGFFPLVFRLGILDFVLSPSLLRAVGGQNRYNTRLTPTYKVCVGKVRQTIITEWRSAIPTTLGSKFTLGAARSAMGFKGKFYTATYHLFDMKLVLNILVYLRVHSSSLVGSQRRGEEASQEIFFQLAGTKVIEL